MFEKILKKAEKDGNVKKPLASKANRNKKSKGKHKYGPSNEVLHQIGINVAAK